MSVHEQQLEDLSISWFQALGWQYANGPDIAPDGDRPTRTDYRQALLCESLFLLVRRTLQRWKYPPDQQPGAVELVLKQAESLSNAWTK